MNTSLTFPNNRLCIVGAGTGGLCGAKNAFIYGLRPTIFEQYNRIGGTWVYNDRTGVDTFGNDIHSSLYNNLRTNLPKEIMDFPDIKIRTHFKSYLHSQCVLNYLETYNKYFNLEDCIQFAFYVLRIKPKNNTWQVIVKDMKQTTITVYNFDFIMICNGHYSKPFIPDLCRSYRGYRGVIFHSKIFRLSTPFAGDHVLVIGAGPSGVDLANEISKQAKKVTLSHNLLIKPNFKSLLNIKQKPIVKKIIAFGAVFSDKSYKWFSKMLLCTGYQYSFPFLSLKCGIYIEENYVQSLLKHCVSIENCSMAFIGIPFYVCASRMMDLQSKFVLALFLWKNVIIDLYHFNFSTNYEMRKRFKGGLTRRKSHMMGTNQAKYYEELSKIVLAQNIPPHIPTVISSLHNESSQRFMEDFVDFRDDIFKLVFEDIFVKIN